MSALGSTITIILIAVVLFLPRRWAALGILSGVCYLTEGQALELATINFTAIRLILLAALIRIIARKEFSFSRLNQIDWILLIFTTVRFLVSLQNSPSSLMSNIGYLYNVFLTYFTFRGLLNDPSTFHQFLKDTVLLILPFTIFMIVEGVTGKNYFSIMGGIPETPSLREGYYRCQASFGHSITAGTLGATLVPLFMCLAFSAAERFRAMIGIILGVSITIASHSGGPLMALLCGVIAWMCWPLRERMRMVRWAIVASLGSLCVIMKAPVWFIIDRVSGIIGMGGGWHRGNLIDQFVNHFREWWLLGMPIENTWDWAATRMPWGGVDVTNEYVSVGLNGGLISLILFILVLFKCYQLLGITMEKIRVDSQNTKREELLLWALGCTLFSHTMNLISVTYWDQSYVMWYMLLAVISGLTEHYLRLNQNIVSK